VGDRVVSVYSTQQQAQETIQLPPKPGLGIGLAPCPRCPRRWYSSRGNRIDGDRGSYL